MSEIIGTLEHKSIALLDESLPQHEVEEIAESLDEEIHVLQYKLDHSRRCLLRACYTDNDSVDEDDDEALTRRNNIPFAATLID